MTEHKFTDEELQKCMECCVKAETRGDCERLGCPAVCKQGCRFNLELEYDNENAVYNGIIKDALDLINRQKAEIERLNLLINGAKTKTVGKFVPRDYIQLTIDDMESET